MTKANLKKSLSELIEEEDLIGLQLFFVYKNDDIFSLFEPALDNIVLEPSLKKDFLSEIKNQLLPENEDWDYEYESLNIAEATDQRRVYHIKVSEIPLTKSLFKLVKSENDIEDYKPGNHDLTGIWAIIIKIGTPNKTVYLFKKNYSINVIKKGKVYPVFFTNGSLQLEEKELLKISKSFDFLYLEEELVILEKNIFEKSFDYVSAVEKRANESIDLILNAKLLDDASKIYDLAQKRTDVKKIISIKSDNPVLKKTAKQIASFAKKYGLQVSLSDDKTRLNLKNQKEARALLKIFNDDYLVSELTNTRYDSKGKLKVESII